MKIHVLVEGRSEELFLSRWLPRAFKGHAFVVHAHQGKGSLAPNRRVVDPRRRGLLDQLPAKLKAFGRGFGDDEGVLVMVDADDESCVTLKKKLVALAESIDPRPHVVFRIAVEETEAFYLGDLAAIAHAYPHADMARARRYEPDSIVGTAELFGQVIGDEGDNKVAWAEVMGEKLTTRPERNRSPSFKALHAGIEKLIAASPRPQPKKRIKHWRAKTARKKR